MIFADSSAVVKIYSEEPGSAEMRTLPLLVVSAICRVEVTSAIWKKATHGDLEEIEAQQLIRDFQADLRSVRPEATDLIAIPVTNVLLRSAAALVPIHNLKALDAIQLSSALAAREADTSCDTFACYDRTLARAAASHGFRIYSPS